MRESARDKSRVEHMISAIQKIEEYTASMSYESFVGNSMCVHATIYNIQIIGEATYMLTKEFKTEYPNLPWPLMEKMRHVLVHDYYRILPVVVWDVVKSDLPSIKPQLISIYESLAI